MNNKVYLATCNDGRLQEYTPTTNAWAYTAPNESHWRSDWTDSAVVVKNKLYVIGQDSCNVYSPEEDRWSLIHYHTFPECAGISQAAAIDDEIVMFAYVNNSIPGSMYTFHHHSGRWKKNSKRFELPEVNRQLHKRDNLFYVEY